MAMTSLKSTINDAMKQAMRAKDKARLGAIRLIQAEIKRIEVDERVDLAEDDSRVISILDKMLKQRKDSKTQYENAGRDDLAAIEIAEIAVIQEFLPTPLTLEELATLIEQAVTTTGATTMANMGQVMNWLKPKLQGRADMAQVSAQIKARLTP